MLWAIAIIFMLLWALGLATSYTMGGYLHILLALAVVTLLFGFLNGRHRRHRRHAARG